MHERKHTQIAIAKFVQSIEPFNYLTFDRNLSVSLPFSLSSLLSPSDLRECSIETLTHGVFDPLKRLKTLWLDGNQLHDIEGHVFGKLTKLETL